MRNLALTIAIALAGVGKTWAENQPPQLTACADFRDMDRAFRNCTEAIERNLIADPKLLAELYINRGAISLERRDLQAARSDFLRAQQIRPGDYEPLHWLGAVAHVSGDHARAIEFYSAALARDPNAAGTRNNRALLYWAAGDVERALADRDENIRRNPRHSQSYLNRAMERAALGQFKQAMMDFKSAHDLKPTSQTERCLAAAILAADHENRGLRPTIDDDCKAALPRHKP